MNKNLLNILFLALFILLSSCKKNEYDYIGPKLGKTGTFIDNRDKKEYKWVKIGKQVWMSENLSYTGSNIKQITDNYDWYNNYNGDAWSYYDNVESNSNRYGILYQWKAAEIACPKGWHLPTEIEWLELENYLKENGYSSDGIIGNNKIAKALATNSGWNKSNISNVIGNSDSDEYRNITGFSAIPCGYRAYTGEFQKKNIEFYVWSATEDDNDIFGNYNLKYDSSKIYTFHDNKNYGFSVRCIKN